MATPGLDLEPTRGARRLRAKLVAAINRVLPDLDRTDGARAREIRMIIHPDHTVEVTLLSRYRTVTDIDVAASDV